MGHQIILEYTEQLIPFEGYPGSSSSFISSPHLSQNQIVYDSVSDSHGVLRKAANQSASTCNSQFLTGPTRNGVIAVTENQTIGRAKMDDNLRHEAVK